MNKFTEIPESTATNWNHMVAWQSKDFKTKIITAHQRFYATQEEAIAVLAQLVSMKAAWAPYMVNVINGQPVEVKGKPEQKQMKGLSRNFY